MRNVSSSRASACHPILLRQSQEPFMVVLSIITKSEVLQLIPFNSVVYSLQKEFHTFTFDCSEVINRLHLFKRSSK